MTDQHSSNRDLTESNWGDMTEDQVLTMRNAMREAVHDGIKDLLTDDEVIDKIFAKAFETLKNNAARASGEFMMDSAVAVIKRMFWFAVAGIIVYMAGGWSALAGMFKFGSLK